MIAAVWKGTVEGLDRQTRYRHGNSGPTFERTVTGLSAGLLNLLDSLDHL
jgi:hypothetical protein